MSGRIRTTIEIKQSRYLIYLPVPRRIRRQEGRLAPSTVRRHPTFRDQLAPFVTYNIEFEMVFEKRSFAKRLRHPDNVWPHSNDDRNQTKQIDTPSTCPYPASPVRHLHFHLGNDGAFLCAVSSVLLRRGAVAGSRIVGQPCRRTIRPYFDIRY